MSDTRLLELSKEVGRKLLSELYSLPHEMSGRTFDQFYGKVEAILKGSNLDVQSAVDMSEGFRKGRIFAIIRGFIQWLEAKEVVSDVSESLKVRVKKSQKSSVLDIYVNDRLYAKTYAPPSFTSLHMFSNGVVVASQTPFYPIVMALSFSDDGNFNFISTFYTTNRPPYALLNSPNVISGLMDVRSSSQVLTLSVPAFVEFTGLRGHKFTFEALPHEADWLNLSKDPSVLYVYTGYLGENIHSVSL